MVYQSSSVNKIYYLQYSEGWNFFECYVDMLQFIVAKITVKNNDFISQLLQNYSKLAFIQNLILKVKFRFPIPTRVNVNKTI